MYFSQETLPFFTKYKIFVIFYNMQIYYYDNLENI